MKPKILLSASLSPQPYIDMLIKAGADPVSIYCPDVANVGKAARERGTDIARNTLSSRLGRVAQDVVSTGVSIARSSSGEPTVTVPSGYSFFIVKKKEL